MFEVESHDSAANAMTFARLDGHVKGGWQGGRGWKVDHAEMNKPDGQYLIAGSWKIENAKELLDDANEYFFDTDAKKLYLWPV